MVNKHMAKAITEEKDIHAVWITYFAHGGGSGQEGRGGGASANLLRGKGLPLILKDE